MPSPGFEPVAPANERQQTHTLDPAVTGTGCLRIRGEVQMHCLTEY
jgi:hypothetical protein